jgi:hypothetical protein
MTTRTLAVLAALPLLASACGGGGSTPSAGCSIAYSGGASETVWCDAPALRTNGATGYVLWVMAFRGGAGLGADQAGQLTLALDARPEVGTEYGFTGAVPTAHVTTGFETRTAGSRDTHEARLDGGLGALAVRFTALPATDGPDAGGLGGVGTVHGTFTATLVPNSGGADVAVSGRF